MYFVILETKTISTMYNPHYRLLPQTKQQQKRRRRGRPSHYDYIHYCILEFKNITTLLVLILLLLSSSSSINVIVTCSNVDMDPDVPSSTTGTQYNGYNYYTNSDSIDLEVHSVDDNTININVEALSTSTFTCNSDRDETHYDSNQNCTTYTITPLDTKSNESSSRRSSTSNNQTILLTITIPTTMYYYVTNSNIFVSQYFVPTYTVLVVTYILGLLFLTQFLLLLPKRVQDTVILYVKPLLPSVLVFQIHHQQRQQQKADMKTTKSLSKSSIKAQEESITTLIGVGEQLDREEQDQAIQQQQEQQQQPINMSGSYQMIKHENLDTFLSVQGVPWPLRRAASSVLPIHHITHQQHYLHIKIEAKSSGFVTQTQYTINGPPVETNVRGRIFSDRVYYSYEDEDENSTHDVPNNENDIPITTNNTITENINGLQSNQATRTEKKRRKCNGIITEKRAITEGYIVRVVRKLIPPTSTTTTKQQIYMTSTVSFPNEPNKQDIVCIQYFDRIE